MSDKNTEAEAGAKWWFRHVIVPLFGSGGLIAVIVALVDKGSPPNPMPSPGPSRATVAAVEALSMHGIALDSTPPISVERFEVSSSWPVTPITTQYGRGIPALSNGEYCWRLESNSQAGGGWFAFIPKVSPQRDVLVQVDLRFDTLSNGNFSGGIMLRASNERGYELLLHSRGYFMIVKRASNGTSDLQDWLAVPEARTKRVNRLGFATYGDTLVAIVNGRRYGPYVDASLPIGSIGLAVYSQGAPTGNVCFSDLEVRGSGQDH